MFKFFNKNYFSTKYKEIDPDEIFLDSRNLSAFNRQQFEGQIEKPISKKSLYFSGLSFLVLGLILLTRVGFLQVASGEEYAKRSENNSLRHIPIFAERGIIYDRGGAELAWNDQIRMYVETSGFAHVLGYIGLPNREDIDTGDFHMQEMLGKSGIEKKFNERLRGEQGIKIEERDVSGSVASDHLLVEPISGESLHLSIDSRLQTKLSEFIHNLSNDRGFVGGAAVIMDVRTGEIIALTSYPEFDPNLLVSGDNPEVLDQMINDSRSPFLNRTVGGAYTPGSIMKLFVSAAALEENIISPQKNILSTGKLIVPNPFNPEHPSIFKDWKAHGYVDMRRAIAVSSNVYFYVVGGGFQDQAGLGIAKIEEYARRFGFGQMTGISLDQEEKGLIPNPEWKEKTFSGEPWRLGDTYNTAIGQYGFLVTPIQVVRAVSALANGGYLLDPTLLKNENTNQIAQKSIGIDDSHLQVVREGMRMAVTEGTSAGLSVPFVKVAAKTGTAQVGDKSKVNSWVTGFFPYNDPHYAFVVLMEKGPADNTIGGVFIMRQLLDWLNVYAPEYLE